MAETSGSYPAPAKADEMIGTEFSTVLVAFGSTRLAGARKMAMEPQGCARRTMKMLAEYLEKALTFERLAADEKTPS